MYYEQLLTDLVPLYICTLCVVTPSLLSTPSNICFLATFRGICQNLDVLLEVAHVDVIYQEKKTEHLLFGGKVSRAMGNEEHFPGSCHPTLFLLRLFHRLPSASHTRM